MDYCGWPDEIEKKPVHREAENQGIVPCAHCGESIQITQQAADWISPGRHSSLECKKCRRWTLVGIFKYVVTGKLKEENASAGPPAQPSSKT